MAHSNDVPMFRRRKIFLGYGGWRIWFIAYGFMACCVILAGIVNDRTVALVASIKSEDVAAAQTQMDQLYFASGLMLTSLLIGVGLHFWIIGVCIWRAFYGPTVLRMYEDRWEACVIRGTYAFGWDEITRIEQVAPDRLRVHVKEGLSDAKPLAQPHLDIRPSFLDRTMAKIENAFYEYRPDLKPCGAAA